jgi:hypothetical protein
MSGWREMVCWADATESLYLCIYLWLDESRAV